MSSSRNSSLQNAATPHKRYLIRLAILMTLYIVFLFIAVRMLGHHDPVTGATAYILGLLPALPVIGVFWAVGRLMSETTDEYQRMLMVRKSLVATGFAMAAATGWGFLEQFDLAAHIPAYYWAVFWFAGLGVGTVFNRLTIGDAGCQ
jgi:hypothetical protein